MAKEVRLFGNSRYHGYTPSTKQRVKKGFDSIISVEAGRLAGDLRALYDLPVISPIDKPVGVFEGLMKIANGYGIRELRADPAAQSTLLNHQERVEALRKECSEISVEITQRLADNEDVKFSEFKAALQKVYGDADNYSTFMIISSEERVSGNIRSRIRVLNFLASKEGKELFEKFGGHPVEISVQCPPNAHSWGVIASAKSKVPAEKRMELYKHWKGCDNCKSKAPTFGRVFETVLHPMIRKRSREEAKKKHDASAAGGNVDGVV